MSSDRAVCPELTILSLGGGVQSTTLLLMAIHGEFSGLEAVIFADTQGESKATYAHMECLKDQADAAGISVHLVTAGNLKQDVLDARGRKKLSRIANPPFYVLNRNGDGKDKGGTLWRGCTRDYKIIPIERKIRELLGVSKGKRVPKGTLVEQWYGISLDEYQRMRTNKHVWIKNRYPLIEKRMTRHDCMIWLQRHGYRVPPKSACTFCPYHSNKFWVDMYRNSPEEFQDVEQFDAELRSEDKLPGVTGDVYVHRRFMPLRQAVMIDADDRQQDFGFESVCDGGYCGV